MYRRSLILTLTIWSLTATFALAESSTDQIKRQLRDQGFSQITVAQTWLGRTRIVGQSKSGQREIILNPRTGEILRDLFTDSGGGQSSGNTVIRNTGSGGSGGGGDNGDSGTNDGGGNSGSGSGEDSGDSGTNDDGGNSGSGSGDSGTDDDGGNSGSGEDSGDSGTDDDGGNSGSSEDSGDSGKNDDGGDDN